MEESRGMAGGICTWSALRAIPCAEGARHAFRPFHVAQWTPGAPSLSVQAPESRRARLPPLRLRPPCCTTIGLRGPGSARRHVARRPGRPFRADAVPSGKRRGPRSGLGFGLSEDLLPSLVSFRVQRDYRSPDPLLSPAPHENVRATMGSLVPSYTLRFPSRARTASSISASSSG